MSKRDKLEGAIEALEAWVPDRYMGGAEGGDICSMDVAETVARLRAQLAALPPEPEPWTPRERRLRKAAKVVLVLVTGGYHVPHEVLGELRDALADTPTPDPRDEALERAKDRVWKVVMFLDGVHRHKLIENYSADYAGLQEARTQAADALAAIARAKGGR